MKLHRCLLAPAWLLSLATGAFAAVPLTSLVNDQAPLVLTFDDVPGLVKNWEQSPWAKTWNDDEVKRFLAPLRANMKIDRWDEQSKAETGYTVSEIVGFASGGALFALTSLDFMLADPDTHTPPVIIAVDFGDNASKVEKMLLDARAKETTKHADETEDFSGVTVRIFHTKKSEAGEGAPMVWAIADGVGLISPSKDAVLAALDALKRGGTQNPFGQSEGFLRTKQHAGDSHATFYMNFRAILPVAQQAIEASPAAQQPNPMGIDLKTILNVLGLDALKEFYLSAKVGEAATETTFGLTYTEQRGLLKMLAYRDGPAPQPGFIPARWISVFTAKYSVRDMYAALEEIVEALSPVASGMAQGYIKTLNKQLEVDLKRDLVGSIGEELVSAYVPKPGASAEAPPSFLEMDQFIGLSLDNPEAFTTALEALKRMAGPSLEQMMPKRDYLGHTLYTFTPPQPGAQEVSYSVAKNYLFLGIGSSAPVEAALQGLTGDQASFWSQPWVKETLADLPPNAAGIQIQDTRTLVAVAFETMIKLAPLLNQPKAPSEDEADAPADADAAAATEEKDAQEENKQIIDPTVKPDTARIARYWGYSGGYFNRESGGLFAKTKLNHAK
jgi:hypothetical protein